MNITRNWSTRLLAAALLATSAASSWQGEVTSPEKLVEAQHPVIFQQLAAAAHPVIFGRMEV